MHIKPDCWRVILAVVAVLLFVAPWTWLPAPLTLELELRTSRAVRLKVYNMQGNELREDTCTVTFADARGSFKRYRLPIYGTSVRALRLQVIPGAVTEFRRVSVNRLGRGAVQIKPAAMTPATIWSTAYVNGETVHIEPAEGATDYHLDIRTEHLVTNARRLEPIVALLLCGCCIGLVTLRSNDTSRHKARFRLWLRRAARYPTARVVAVATVWLVIATVAKLNGSSTAIWRFYAEGRLPFHHLTIGTPKDVRSDEWMVQTPWILSQAAREPKFSTFNNNIGDGPTTLLTNVPVWHWTMLFRPQFWAFFFLSPEIAFAWYWNLKWYALCMAAFLFFRVVARGSALIALAGTALVFFAGYVQWWYSTGASLPEMLGMTFLILWAGRVLMRGKGTAEIITAALALIVGIENFIFCCYPRFQVPLAYFAVITGAAMMARSGMRQSQRVLRLSGVAAVLLITVTLTSIWYREVGPLLAATSRLDYPGRIFSIGGGFEWYRFFIPYLEWGMGEFHFPHGLTNASNASGFVLLLPFVVALLWRSRRWDAVVVALLLFIALTSYFMLVGVPAGLARYSGWSMVYATRGMLPVGISAITCLVRLLSMPSKTAVAGRGSTLLAFILIAAAFYQLLSVTNAKYLQFVPSAVVVATAAYLGVITALFLGRARTLAVGLLLVPTVLSTGLVNPIGRGLPAFFASDTFNAVKTHVTRDRTARWVVLGGGDLQFRLPHYLTAAGANVIGGTRCNPDTELMSLIDPRRTYFDAWNRFALIEVERAAADEPKVTQTSGLSYTISLPLTPEWLQKVGVRYIAQGHAEPPLAIDGFSKTGSFSEFRIFSRTR